MTPVYVWILLVQVCTHHAGLERCTGTAIDGPFLTAVECEFMATRMQQRDKRVFCERVPG